MNQDAVSSSVLLLVLSLNLNVFTCRLRPSFSFGIALTRGCIVYCSCVSSSCQPDIN